MSPLPALRRAGRAVTEAAVTALALLTAVGLALEAWRPGSAVHPHFMGTLGRPALDAALAGAFAAVVLLRRPLARRWPRAAPSVGAAVAALVVSTALFALGRHVAALGRGDVLAAAVAPPATAVAVVGVAAWAAARLSARDDAAPPRRPVARWLGVAAAAAGLVVVQIEAVGATDYRAPADVIVVLGSRVRPDGTPSGSLADRTRTACALYRAGYAPRLLFSGGHGADAPASEPEVMRALALEAGVPASAIGLDPTGVDTEATIATTARLARDQGWSRVLVVSHDYHLARVRLLAARAGLAVRTVPAVETHAPGWKVAAVAREVLAYAAAWALGRG